MNKNIKDYASKGGKARLNKLSPQVRSDIARKASQARWKNHTKQASKCLPIPEVEDEECSDCSVYIDIMERYKIDWEHEYKMQLKIYSNG